MPLPACACLPVGRKISLLPFHPIFSQILAHHHNQMGSMANQRDINYNV